MALSVERRNIDSAGSSLSGCISNESTNKMKAFKVTYIAIAVFPYPGNIIGHMIFGALALASLI